MRRNYLSSPAMNMCKRVSTALIATAALTVFAPTASAACSYSIDNQWGSGFVASITITNDTNVPITSWNVNWQYNTNRMSSGWNANFSGANPYTATNMNWNGNIAPGQSVSFGVQGETNGGSVERPTINGSVCGGSASSTPVSSSSSSRSSSSISSSVISSSSSSSFSSASSTPGNTHPTCPSQRDNAFQMYVPTIPATIQAEDFDPAGYLDSSATNEGGAYRTDTGVDIKSISGGNAVGWMTNGEWLEYTLNVEQTGDYDVTIRSGSISTGRTLKISQCNTTLLNTFAVPVVNNWGEFKTWSAGKIRLQAGYQKIRVEVGAQDYLDLDWIHIGQYSGTIDPSEPEVGAPVRSAGCGKPRSLQNGRINLQSGGTQRSYILDAPANYNNNNPYRLIIGYHWLNGNAEDVATGRTVQRDTWAHYGMKKLAGTSTIFVAPEGINAGWANGNGSDVNFTDTMLAQLKAELCIDESRVFANGFSFGGSMSYAIACARPNVFRAVAAYGAGQVSGCAGGTQPAAYFGGHGVRDNVFPMDRGRALRDKFVTNNRCTAMNPPEPAIGSLTHRCTSYQCPNAQYPVRWCAYDAGHIAAPQDDSTGDSGNTWLAQEAWQFFTQF